MPKTKSLRERCFVYDLDESLMSECLRLAKEMENEKQEASFCK